MKKTLFRASLVALCVGTVAAAFAQEPPIGTKRPKILQIFVEEVKPGRQPAHAKNEISLTGTTQGGPSVSADATSANALAKRANR